MLSGNREIRPLLNKAQALTALQRHFISVAPAHLGQSCQVLGLETGTLTISVANATIAAKLRQIAPELVALLQNKACQVSGIRVKVQVSFNSGRHKPAPRILSKAARSALNELSCGLNDSPLKNALERMGRKKTGTQLQ
ncbi:MAG: hypothetical protein A2V79_05240 [Betaproteobacteria bacterium RBG_16_56_24]|nr:MAG: hypothetical protein A2V79_05240 [Betaproteobacteria bacterium RBG_16_56_24]